MRGRGEAEASADPPAAPAGRPFGPGALLNKAVSNVISSLTYGRRFEYDDPRLLQLLELTQQALKQDSGFLREVRGGSPREERVRGLGGRGRGGGAPAPPSEAARAPEI